MNTYLVLCVVIMAVFTYLPRMLPLTFFRKKIQSPMIRSMLYYVPYAVLASLTFPAVFMIGNQPISALSGTLAAIYCAYREKGLVFVAVVAMVVYYLTSLII